jgi:prepilin-type processing-associated H-X9-DG protein
VGWSARILSFLEHEELWRQSLRAYQQTLEFRADPPHPIRTVLPVYTCPADGRTLANADAMGVTVALAEYLGSAGTNLFRQDGVLYLDSRVTLHDVTDGASNTLLVGERPPSAGNVLGWWYAGMGQNRDGSADLHLGVRERNVYERIPDCPPGPYAFRAGRVDQMCDLFHFWSPHPGGAHFLFCDGSVRFLAYSADPLLPALATRAGGEPAALPD